MTDDIIDKAIEFIKLKFSGDFSGHDFHHSMRVFRTAGRLAEAEGAKLITVQLAALLHDVDDVKLSPDTSTGLLNAVSFLRENGTSEELIEEIKGIISSVSFKGKDSVTPGTIEGKCVQDADRLDAMGAIGIARTFAFGGSRGRSIYDPDIPPKIAMSAKEYYGNENSTSLNHFYEKLLLLKDMMNTETAKKIAEGRQTVMENYLTEFFAEWDGER